MKATILLAILALCNFIGTSQDSESFGFKKGDFTISGTISYSNRSDKSDRNTSESYTNESENFLIVPEIGYFLSDHFLVGIKTGYLRSNYSNFFGSDSESELKNENENKEQGYTANLFGRYYFNPKKRISLFTDIEAGYADISTESRRIEENVIVPDSSYDGERKNYTLNISPGINIFINERVSFTSKIGQIGYTKSKSSNTRLDNEISYSGKADQYNLRLGLDNLFFGVLYRI